MITITDLASQEIKRQANEKGKMPIIRVGVRGGGCTGFQMFIEWPVSTYPTDMFYTKDDASVIVDPKSLVLLDGSTIDYESTLMKKGFKINAPKVISECGFGESVNF